MEYPKTGGDFAKRVVCSCAAALLLLVTLLAAPSPGADITLSSRTYFLYYKRDVPGEASRRFAPVYEYLSADANGLGGTTVSFHFYGWGRQDMGEKTGSGKTSGDLGSAYLQYLHPTGNAEMRLGRFFLAEGVAREIVDGVFLKGRTGSGFGASAFGGVPVEATITATATGDSIYGGRLFFARPGFAELGVSYLQEKGEFQGNDRKEVGGDLWVRPFGTVELIGNATYNDATRALAFQGYMIRLSPFTRVDFSFGYEEYSYKDYFQTSLSPVFLAPAIDNTDKARIVIALLDLEVVKNVTLTLGAKTIRHDQKDPGDARRGELGVKYVYNDLKDAAGASFAWVTADLDENAYGEYRGYATWSPSRWRFALDALTRQYKQAIDGMKNALQVVGSAGFHPFDILRISGDLTYTKSPRFDKDYAGLVRVSLLFGPGAGGKK